MKTIYLIDGYLWSYVAFYAHMGQQLESPSGEPTTGTFIFLKTLFKLLKNYSPDMLCVCMDSPGRTFRKKLYADYKSSRPESMPEGILLQMNRIEQILHIMQIPVFHAPGFEGDDIIGTVAEKASLAGFHSTICTKDKDMLQLIQEGVVEVLDINKDKITGVAEVVEKWGIHPHQFIDFLAFQGDQSDHVPGVHGIGKKKAVDLLVEWGDAETAYKNLRAIGGSTAKKLTEGREIFDLSKILVTIRKDVPLDINWEDMTVKEFNWVELNSIFQELGFNSLIHAVTSTGRRLF